MHLRVLIFYEFGVTFVLTVQSHGPAYRHYRQRSCGGNCGSVVRKLSDHRITVISSETDHFYARTALMYIYMGHMRYQETKPYEDHFWTQNNIDLVRGYATQIDTQSKVVRIADGVDVAYDALLLATGSKSNLFGWPGQDLPGYRVSMGCRTLL